MDLRSSKACYGEQVAPTVTSKRLLTVVGLQVFPAVTVGKDRVYRNWVRLIVGGCVNERGKKSQTAGFKMVIN